MHHKQVEEIINEECQVYGPIPRDMFLSDEEFTDRLTMWTDAVNKLGDTFNEVDNGLTNNQVRHRLLLTLADERFKLGKSTWRGTFFMNMVMEKLFSDFVKRLDCQLYSATNGNLKLFEINAMGLLRLVPKYFSFVPIPWQAVNNSSRIESTTKVPDVLVGEQINYGESSFKVRSSTNREMRDFCSNMNLRGIVTPAKDQYPVIDGIARFEYKGTLITAFLQVTVAERQKAGIDGLMNLKELYDLVLSAPKPQNKAHRTVFLWITSTFSKPKDGKDVKSLDNQLSEQFRPHIEEYIVHNILNSQTIL